jgi:hypothetical protein
MNLNSPRTIQAVSFAAIIIGLGAHFISAHRKEEIYVVCAVSIWIRFFSIISGPDGQFAMSFALLGFGLLVFAYIALALGLLILSVGTSVRLIFRPNSRIWVFQCAALSYGFLAFGTSIGLELSVDNRSLKNWVGVDRIVLSQAYFILAVLLACVGVFYAFHLHSVRKLLPNQSPDPTLASGTSPAGQGARHR